MDAVIPEMIPINALSILEKARGASSTFIIVATTPLLSTVVTVRNATRPARPAAPCWSFDKPIATPTANSMGSLSITALPIFTSAKPIIWTIPVTSPPCMVAGHMA